MPTNKKTKKSSKSLLYLLLSLGVILVLLIPLVLKIATKDKLSSRPKAAASCPGYCYPNRCPDTGEYTALEGNYDCVAGSLCCEYHKPEKKEMLAYLLSYFKKGSAVRDSSLYIVDKDGKAVKSYKNLPRDRFFSISPQGTIIHDTDNNMDTNELVIRKWNDFNQTSKIPIQASKICRADWTADGSKVAIFYAVRMPQNDLYDDECIYTNFYQIKDSIGGQSIVLIKSPSDYDNNYEMSWAPDGSKFVQNDAIWVAIQDLDPKYEPYISPPPPGSLGKSERIYENEYNEVTSSYSWSPDGKTIAFIGHYVHIYDVAAKEFHSILPINSWKNYDGNLAWSPDGTMLLFYNVEDSLTTVMDIKGNIKRNIPNYYCPSFSPDGKYLLCAKTYHDWESSYFFGNKPYQRSMVQSLYIEPVDDRDLSIKDSKIKTVLDADMDTKQDINYYALGWFTAAK